MEMVAMMVQVAHDAAPHSANKTRAVQKAYFLFSAPTQCIGYLDLQYGSKQAFVVLLESQSLVHTWSIRINF